MIFTQLRKCFVAASFLTAATSLVHAQPRTYYQQSSPYAYGQSSRPYASPSYYYGTPTAPAHQTRQAPARTASSKSGSSKVSAKSAAQHDDNADNSGWLTNWNAAWAKAKKQGRPLVTIVVHHGCPVCDQLDATLARPDAMRTLENAVKVRVEFTENADFLNRTGVKLTPTFLVFSPASDGEVYREVGALSLERLQSLKPSLDSLVTGPQPSPASTRRRNAKADVDLELSDDSSSRTIASL